MTQTPSRDWQKDMDGCDGLPKTPWTWLENENGEWFKDANGNVVIGCDVSFLDWSGVNVDVEKLFRFFLNAPEALPYWLQEAKKWEGGTKRWSKVAHDIQKELDVANIRADAAEAREQRLKEELEGALRFIGRTEHIPEETVAGFIRAHFSQALSTLYPDTPAPAAPKEGGE